MTLRDILAAAFLFVFVAAAPLAVSAERLVEIDGDDIAGVVTTPVGPEAGVWVIAESTDLGARFAKIVVTDASGTLCHPRPSESQISRSGCVAMGSSTRRRSRPNRAASILPP